MSSPTHGNVPFTELMALDRIDDNTFRSIARPWSPGNGDRAFGGHVYAQAAYAASQTVGKGFVVHNITGLFILPGLLDVPFVYTIQRIREGGSYCTRSVTVTQNPSAPPAAQSTTRDPICFTALVSLKRDETSPYSHQAHVDLAQKYTTVLWGKKSPTDHPAAPSADRPAQWTYEHTHNPPDSFPGVEVRKVNMTPYNSNQPPHGRAKDPIDYRQLQYYRAIGSMPKEDVNLHACAHLYASDRNSMFLVTNALGIGDGFGMMASLSHIVVLHVGTEELLMVDRKGEKRWFCQEAWTERSGGGRGLHVSRIWDEKGVHIGSTMQDGMVRLKRGEKGEKGAKL
ncbi:MAG: hypothetical protein M1830_001828 [Pleopsidium flavum]|nr:MAG: hypothetical protein M1830_001828 [Pleopsidium flavum]